jgi:protein-tyrosine phosphatase
VVEIRRFVVCTEDQLYWDQGSEPAQCLNEDHEHRVIETHRHRSPVVLPDGTQVTAVSFDPADPYSRARDPDYGLYFDSRWQPPWDHGYVDWPDFGVPANGGAVVESLKAVLERARSGQDIEVGCIGGHGRTGTALACLAVLAGHPASGAVAWVRSSYCAKAVETPEQEAFIAAVSNS